MRLLTMVLFLFTASMVYAQEDLLEELEKQQGEQTDITLQTFKGTRLINGHSVETKPGGALEFIISHRFGTLNSGSYNLWGLDASTIRLGLEYGITDHLGIGVGRSSFDKSYDGYLKYKLLRQASGAQAFPFTLTLLASAQYKTNKSGADEGLSSSDRTSYAFQALIARKISSGFSLQLAPVLVHRNAVEQDLFVNDLVALGIGGRARITRSVSLHLEYYARLNEKEGNPNHDAIGVGIDIETGGHVFQLVFTNTIGMMERIFVAETNEDFFDGDIHFGFNITRTFQLSKKARASGKDW
ncbi:MAG TPA: DUF5777 family beta-barrel protein [Cyclobacteriaceae bacterium]